jgi:NAD+ synthetase
MLTPMPIRERAMDFYNLYSHGFARVAACTLPITLVQPRVNAEAVLAQATQAAAEGACLAVFPELALSGYSIEDLLLQDTLLAAVEDALDWLVPQTAELGCIIVVGAPLTSLNRIYNTAVVIHRGQVLGVVPKSYLPNYREFYERRQIAPGDDVTGEIRVAGQDVPFGSDLLFAADDLPGFVLGVEICEDLWVPIPPSAELALAGATVLVNLSGSPITVAKAEARKLLCASGSSRLLAGYLFAAAGEGESSTDLSWDGQTLIYENGTLLAESERFPNGPRMSVADLDLGTLVQERLRQGTFDDNRRTHAERIGEFRTVTFTLTPPSGDLGLRREVARFPFVPADPARLAQDCYEAYSIQVSGLEQRLREIGQPKVVIGVSGGLDSTHALIVAARAMDRMGRPRSDILAYTMPGFATSDHTRDNATALATALGVSFATLDITATAKLMLDELDHPFSDGQDVFDVTFENVQAGLRTDYLFRLANHRGGIVLGTGDLSELALGWCTYGVGDQMSHYNVNAGVPKTLIQHLIRWVIAADLFSEEVGVTLQAILDTEISPELVPVAAGEKPQSTQAKIGPYALQDFTLFHVLRQGMRPSKIAFLAWHAWQDAEAGAWPEGFPADERVAYDLATIKKWLGVFCSRFFGFAQFKRSALPNGPKVVAGGSLSPRGDWRAPSDTSAKLWLDELGNVPES